MPDSKNSCLNIPVDFFCLAVAGDIPLSPGPQFLHPKNERGGLHHSVFILPHLSTRGVTIGCSTQ